jgi:hypothetical protein
VAVATELLPPPPPSPSPSPSPLADSQRGEEAGDVGDDVDETSSLMSKGSSLPGDVLLSASVDLDRSHRVDIRGWQLLRNLDFWQQWLIMGILSGIGLMTIK